MGLQDVHYIIEIVLLSITSLNRYIVSLLIINIDGTINITVIILLYKLFEYILYYYSRSPLDLKSLIIPNDKPIVAYDSSLSSDC